MWNYGSDSFSINQEELMKVLRGLGIAALGGIVAYATTYLLPEWKESPGWLALVVYPIASAGVNFLRKFVFDNSQDVISKD